MPQPTDEELTGNETFRSPSGRPIRAAVSASDSLVRAGLLSELRTAPGIEIVENTATAEVVVAVDEGDLPHLAACGVRLVLIADEHERHDFQPAVEQGLLTLVPRNEATAPRLLRAIVGAVQAGREDISAERFSTALRGLSPADTSTSASADRTGTGVTLTHRETAILRLLADGMDTAEIALELLYSERTVKNLLHGLLARLGLRNRAHAVAFGLRHGLI